VRYAGQLILTWCWWGLESEQCLYSSMSAEHDSIIKFCENMLLTGNEVRWTSPANHPPFWSKGPNDRCHHCPLCMRTYCAFPSVHNILWPAKYSRTTTNCPIMGNSTTFCTSFANLKLTCTLWPDALPLPDLFINAILSFVMPSIAQDSLLYIKSCVYVTDSSIQHEFPTCYCSQWQFRTCCSASVWCHCQIPWLGLVLESYYSPSGGLFSLHQSAQSSTVSIHEFFKVCLEILDDTAQISLIVSGLGLHWYRWSVSYSYLDLWRVGALNFSKCHQVCECHKHDAVRMWPPMLWPPCDVTSLLATISHKFAVCGLWFTKPPSPQISYSEFCGYWNPFSVCSVDGTKQLR
jgi:hypothetical protein